MLHNLDLQFIKPFFWSVELKGLSHRTSSNYAFHMYSNTRFRLRRLTYQYNICMCEDISCAIYIYDVCLEKAGPEVIKLFSCSAELSMKFSLLINMKMPTIVGIFIFIIRENFHAKQCLARNNLQLFVI